MKINNWLKILIGLAIFLITAAFSSLDRIMLTMKSQSLHKGKVVNVDARLFFDNLNGRLLTLYTNPSGQIMITNATGELSIYNQDENTVVYRQGIEFSTENNFIQYFLQGKTSDLGLGEFGFQVMDTRFEDNMVVTEWFPPASLFHLYNKIVLVHKDFLPIYIAYYDAQRNLAKKVYYSDYQYYDDVSIPALITEFNYVGGDSIINRLSISDIRTGASATSSWFSFEIPSDAVLKP